jgi:NADH-quinone oxidoreductase subunit A
VIAREFFMALEYGPVAVLLTFGVVIGVASLIMAWLLSPRDSYPAKETTYECGMDPIGSAWGQFYARYYLIALVFVVFDVEAIFLFPWATVFRRLSAATAMGPMPLVEAAVFILILLVGLAYAWRKGDLEWTR